MSNFAAQRTCAGTDTRSPGFTGKPQNLQSVPAPADTLTCALMVGLRRERVLRLRHRDRLVRLCLQELFEDRPEQTVRDALHAALEGHERLAVDRTFPLAAVGVPCLLREPPLSLIRALHPSLERAAVLGVIHAVHEDTHRLESSVRLRV